MRNQRIPVEHWERIRRKLSSEYECVCELLRTTGYRVDDVLHSRIGQWYEVDKPRRVVAIKERKTGKLRVVKLTEAARDVLARYRRMGGRQWSDVAFLVPSARQRPQDAPKRHRTSVYRHFAQAVFAAGLDGLGYTVHSLRKMYAYDAYQRCGSLLTVQRDLGHARLDTTMWYVVGDSLRL